MQLRAPFKLLYNNDTTNTAGCVSPWHEKGEAFREEHLIASIDETAGCGVDAHFLSPGLGWVPWWQSTVAPFAEHFAWWKSRTGLERDTLFGYHQYVADGGDMVRVLIERCRQHGMAPFVTFRMNDVHLQEHYGEPTPESIFVSRFYAEHTEFLLDPNHKKVKGYYPLRGLNWAHAPVREFKLSLIRELCTDYDLAGIELDFLRDNNLFRQDETTAEQRVALITEFVRQVRIALDARRVGGVEHRWLCVRIPADVRAHAAIGLDLKSLADAGVDMFNLSTWYHTPFRTDVAEARRVLPNSALYVELTHCIGNHGYFLDSGGYGTLGNPRCSDAELMTAAHLALASGADGISLFNFVYYRNHGPDVDIPISEPPFHVLPKLRDAEFLSRQAQHYTLGNACYFGPMPQTLNPRQNVALRFDLALPVTRTSTEPPKKSTPNGKHEPIYGETGETLPRLRLHLQSPLGNRQIAVNVNGQRATPTQNISRHYGNPFDSMISPHTHRAAFEFPRAWLKSGVNTVDVLLVEGEAVQLIYADLSVT